jgi:hypothetical protein
MIYQPIAQFVRLVKDSPDLSKRYAAKAAAYLEAAEAAMAIFDDEWREDEKTGEGWLIWRRGSPISFDGGDQPHNQFLALGSALLQLSFVASSPPLAAKYRDRATKMARTFKNDLTVTPQGGWLWPYFWSKGRCYNGWRASDDVSDYQPTFVHGGRHNGHKAIEDSSHAHIDVTFARWAYDAGLGVFDETDMKRFAATYAKQIVGGERSSELVNGRGEQGRYDSIAAVGTQFARWEPEIVAKVVELYRSHAPVGAPQGRLLGTAFLNVYGRAGAS